MRELLYDDYRIFGCGLESLVSFAREFDQTSRTVLLDFSEATIYSMLPGKDDFAAIFNPGGQLRVKRESRRESGPPFSLEGPDVVRSNVTTLLREGYLGLAKELRNSPKYHGTYFRIKNSFWYTSNACAKTLAQRFEVNTKSCLERDMFLGYNISNYGKHKFWVTSRKDGNVNKIIGFFSKKPSIISVSELVRRLLTNSNITVHQWEFSQIDGLTIMFDVNSVLQDIGEVNGMVPCLVLQYCDSGHALSCIKCAWRPKENFQTHISFMAFGKEYKTEDEYQKWGLWYDEAVKYLKQTAMSMVNSGTIPAGSKEELLENIYKMVGSSGVMKKLSRENIMELENGIRAYVELKIYSGSEKIRVGDIQSLLLYLLAKIAHSSPDYTAKMLMEDYGNKVIDNML